MGAPLLSAKISRDLRAILRNCRQLGQPACVTGGNGGFAAKYALLRPMRRALLWFLLIALSLAVVLMLSGRGGQGTISNLSSNDFASMLVNIGWLKLSTSKRT